MVPRREEWGKGQLGSWEEHVHTAVFKMDNQRDLTVGTGSSVLCGSLDGRGWGRVRVHARPRRPPEMIMAVLVSCTLI